MEEQFISEAISPIRETMDIARMATGEPGLPHEFIWHGNTITVQKVLRHWKTMGPCTHGSDEKYLRRHWYEIATDSGAVMKIYFQKPAKSNRKKAGWWLFSLTEKS